jgi:predicted MFS family arabinose efflux permease
MAVGVGLIVANGYYIQPLLAVIGRAFHASLATVGSLAMVTQIGTALGMLLFVPLGDKYERRSLITLLVSAAGISLALLAASANLAWLLLACFAVGASTATVHVIVPFAAHLAPERDRGRIVGFVLSGMLIGILLARTFSGFWGSAFGWRSVYWFAAAVMFLLAATYRRMLPRAAPVFHLSWSALMGSIAGLVRKHSILRQASFSGAMSFGAFSAFWTTLIFLLGTPPFHYGAKVAGLFGLVGVVGAAAAPLVGHFADKKGTWTAVLLGMLITFSGFLVLLAAGRTLLGLILGVILLDAGVQATHVANQTRIYALDPGARGRLNTVYMVSYFVGGALGSYFGTICWIHAKWTGVCLFALGMLGLALVTHLFSPKSRAAIHSSLEREPLPASGPN